MDLLNQPLQYHYRPAKGWINDPNGLIEYQGWYHVFFQYNPNFEVPGKEPVCWGHARTRDFVQWEELPPALVPGRPEDAQGCWSGTAVEKDGRLYLFYASIRQEPGWEAGRQTISVAWSDDGIHFEKYEQNPVIAHYPSEGSADFRDPAVLRDGDTFYLVIGSGNPQAQAARLLVYQSEDLLHWRYNGVMAEWPGCKDCECPSFMHYEQEYLLTTSVEGPLGTNHRFFNVLYGSFDGQKFIQKLCSNVHHGPDQYAGQAFVDSKGRHILLTWVTGWSFIGFAERSLGCMSLPVELTLTDGKLKGYPIEEVRHLLKDGDPLLQVSADGFVLPRTRLPDVVHKGPVHELKVLRDGYVMEIFVNGGEAIYTAVLC